MASPSERIHQTRSGIPLKPWYGPEDVSPDARASAEVGPGVAPFARGAYSGMYRSKPWRIFQLSGYGSPEELNERLKFLLRSGETGIIMKRDRVTNDHLYDPDHPEVLSRREDVGQTGCVLLSGRDVQRAIDGIPATETYAHPGAGVVQAAPFCLTSYWTAGMRQGARLDQLQGTGQSDFFLTYVGCITKEQIPPHAGLRLNGDLIEFCTEKMPKWVPVSIAGYNGADSGLNAWQELGAVMANAIEYLDMVKARGYSLDEFAKGIGGVNFRVSMDFFEDMAKLRAARKMWHNLLTRRYGVTDDKALRLRIHIVTAGSAMTYQQPLNNIVRGTLMALASVLGGTQSLGVSGYDEALSIPSDHAHQMSIRIQQILQHEPNLTSVADPLGGSYFIESLTESLEEKAWEFVDQIEKQGGFISSIDSGWLQNCALDNQWSEISAIEDGSMEVVGVNMATDDVDEFPIDGFDGGGDAWERADDRIRTLRSERHTRGAMSALEDLRKACASDANVIPVLLDAVQADVSIGEVGAVFRDVFGTWDAPIEM